MLKEEELNMWSKEPEQIEKDPSTPKSPFTVFPIEMEQKIMTLEPGEEKVFHGDCELICKHGGAVLTNPLPGEINLLGDGRNKPSGVNRYYVDGMIFGLKAKNKGLTFSLRRPYKFK